MSQKTNLNISPYYDNFDAEDNFYKVLFRPGRPVQARELTTLQSILQNQIESFGKHVFKEGSLVIPGNVSYDDRYYSVKIDSEHLGLPVSLYANELKGKKLKGQNTGIEIIVDDCKYPSDSPDITDPTLFVKYLTADDSNKDASLEDGEPLIAQESIVYGNTTIDIGDSVANLIETNASAVGSAVRIANGIYFIRGTFVDVAADTLILDPYDNNPKYRVGLNILESIITAKDDSSLYDNAKGFSNFAAPGADRLKITTTLAKKSLNDFNDTSFVEVIRLDDGEVKKLINTSQYSYIMDMLAQRTYEESGNYALGNINVNINDSLDNGVGNNGIFKSDESTKGYNGQGDDPNTPSDDLAAVSISAGVAYVKGKRVERSGGEILDLDKPRDKEAVETAKVPFEMGSLLRVNNVSGTPLIGINNNNNTVYLTNQRKEAVTQAALEPQGTGIGTARVYSFGLRNTPYVNGSSEWDLYLYDVQTYTELTINEAISLTDCPISSFIRGVSSDATGYLAGNPGGGTSGTTLLLSQTSGTFIAGESILINEVDTLPRSIKSLSQYGVNDIKSVYQDTSSFTGMTADFAADTVLRETPIPGFSPTATVNVVPSGTNDYKSTQGTITSPGNTFSDIKVGTIVKYQADPLRGASAYDKPQFNKVTSVSADLKTLNVVQCTEVAGVTTGFVGVATGAPLSIVRPQIVDNDNSGLYTPIEIPNVSDVSLENSELVISTQIKDKTPSSGGLTVNVSDLTGIQTAFFSNFDTQKYSISYSDGTIQKLTSEQVNFEVGSTKLSINGLSNTACTVNVTVEKQEVKEKNKEFVRSKTLTVNKTATPITGSASADGVTDNGLTQNKFYGLRVEDREISLNNCDVVNVAAVLESRDSSAPTLDKLTFVSGLGLQDNAIVGERIIGSETDAIAQIVSRPSQQQVEFVYLNSSEFDTGELVTFEESNIKSTIQSITLGNYTNITSRYELDKGQREQFYDYSRLVRRRNLPAPSRQLLVIYNYYNVDASDTGDVYTVNSYDKDRFSNDVPHFANGIRATDTLDFRPRLSEFAAVDKSPFAWTTRNFGAAGATSSVVVSPEGDSKIGYSYYLPRIDKVILTALPATADKYGEYSIIKGSSSLTPHEPALIDDSMHIATIDMPAYLYNASDAKISLVENKRYTMRDIGKIDDRVSNLEVVTSLTMLELDTKSFQVRDAVGDRFKSGFFVDDFKDTKRMDRTNPDNKISIDSVNAEMVVPLDRFTNKPELGLDTSINVETADFSQNLQLLDPNVVKTGDLITLKYDDVAWIENTQASRVENINPFNVVIFRGRITLNPSSDNWTETKTTDKDDIILLGDPEDVGTSTETVQTGSQQLPFMRSRNVGFKTHGLKALIRYYPFFDGRSGIDIVPKLIEITMQSGSFRIGEMVKGFGISPAGSCRFRVAQPNHRSGTYNSPTTTYGVNPYEPGTGIAAAYTESSTVLNVDIASLCEEAQGDYYGFITKNMQLTGVESGAIATVSNVRLIADNLGNLNGAFFVRDPNWTPAPPLRFSNGTKTFKLTSSDTNTPQDETPGNSLITEGQTTYTTSGILNLFERTTTIIRPRPIPEPEYADPLAQSFFVDESGAFLSGLDLYFFSKDDTQRLTVQVRTVELGTPTNQVVADYAEVELDPAELDSTGTSIIKTSDDASVPTRVTFPSPVYLEAGREYAIVLLAPNTQNYQVWLARMGDVTIETKTLGEGSQSKITKQYIGGSLFKSQNGTIWTPSQFEDLKFTLYKCSFITGTTGDLTLYNSSIKDNAENNKLITNAIKSYPRKLKVQFSNTPYITDFAASYVPGKKVSGWVGGTAPSVPTDAEGYIEKIGGRIGEVSITGVGTGYPLSKSGSNLTGVEFYTITGNGSGAVGVVTTNASGEIIEIGVEGATADKGYCVGDVLGIKTSSLGSTAADKIGSDARITVTDMDVANVLYLTNVQGDSFNAGNWLIQYESDGTTTTLGAATTTITSSEQFGALYSGNVMEIQQYNHSMTADTNRVSLKGIEPNSIPVNLTSALTSTDTTISVSTATFSKAEGISTSTGYVQIGKEVIYYDGISVDALNIGTRGYGDTPVSNHTANTPVYPYEFNGFSLVGINTTHDMVTSSALKAQKTIDSYVIEAKRTGRTNLPNRTGGRAQLSFTEEGFAGGSSIQSSKNFQYDGFSPSFNVLTPGSGTEITSQLRSVSGTSDGGSEVSYKDEGYTPVEFNQVNRLSTPRLLASKVDEELRLTNLPRNKSVTLLTNFKSSDPNLSPVLDTQNGAFRFFRNRLNNPVVDYTADSRSNALTGDPHAACYISQRVNLSNPSTSLKVLIGAYRGPTADFRVLYRLFKPDSAEVNQSYELFPGYDNLRDVDIELQVVDPAKNSGRADRLVRASKENEFLDYEFTANNLDEFTGFQIKVVISGTNEADPPRFKDLRVIALA